MRKALAALAATILLLTAAGTVTATADAAAKHGPGWCCAVR